MIPLLTRLRDRRHQLSRANLVRLKSLTEHWQIPGQELPLETCSRIPSLDGLRAVSLACVLLAHLSGTRHFFRWECWRFTETSVFGSSS